ncbi:unnamed protein product, partial [Ectocarpus sp. 8 AP-2014]
TPAFFSAQDGHTECLSLLLSLGADSRAVDPDGRTPLHLAAAAGDALMCGILLEHGA